MVPEPATADQRRLFAYSRRIVHGRKNGYMAFQGRLRGTGRNVVRVGSGWASLLAICRGLVLYERNFDAAKVTTALPLPKRRFLSSHPSPGFVLAPQNAALLGLTSPHLLLSLDNNTAHRVLEQVTFIMPEPPIANPGLPPPPTGKYPAKDHCRRVARWIADSGGPSSGVIYLEGTGTHMKEVSA